MLTRTIGGGLPPGDRPEGMVQLPDCNRFLHPLESRVISVGDQVLLDMLKTDGYLGFNSTRALAIYQESNCYFKAYFDGLLLARNVSRAGYGHLNIPACTGATDVQKSAVKHLLRTHFADSLKSVCSTESEIEFNFSLGRLEVYGCYLTHLDPIFGDFKSQQVATCCHSSSC